MEQVNTNKFLSFGSLFSLPRNLFGLIFTESTFMLKEIKSHSLLLFLTFYRGFLVITLPIKEKQHYQLLYLTKGTL